MLKLTDLVCSTNLSILDCDRLRVGCRYSCLTRREDARIWDRPGVVYHRVYFRIRRKKSPAGLFFAGETSKRLSVTLFVARFRGGLVLKAHRLAYHSTLGWRVIKQKRRFVATPYVSLLVVYRTVYGLSANGLFTKLICTQVVTFAASLMTFETILKLTTSQVANFSSCQLLKLSTSQVINFSS